MNKTALVTGASAGLGLEFCRQLAAQGYQLVMVARSRETLEQRAAELEDAFGVKAQVFPADLSDIEAPQTLFDSLQAQGIQVDYLVNNAGVAGPNLLEEPDWGNQERFFTLMMTSIAHMCQLFAPPMAERGFGRIINIASAAARVPRAGGCNYGPAKAWVVALSEELDMTLRDSGVRCCALCPGFTHTEFHERANLMAMKNSLPKWMWYDADVVVRDGLRAIERGRSVYLSGRLYRLLDPFFQSVWTRRFFKLQDRRDHR